VITQQAILIVGVVTAAEAANARDKICSMLKLTMDTIEQLNL